MTLDDLYDAEVQASIDSWKNPLVQYIKSFGAPPVTNDIVQLLSIRNDLNESYESLSAMTVVSKPYDVLTKIKVKFMQLRQTEEEKHKSIEASAQLAKEKLVEETQQHNQEVISYNNDLTKGMEKKHAMLARYKKAMMPIFERYGITASSMVISDTTTEQEFNTMLDASIEICSKYTKQNKNYMSKLLNVFRDDDPKFGAMIFILTIVITYFTLPVLSPIAYGFIIYNVVNMTKNVDRLKLARALMAEVDYKRFVPKENYMELLGNPDTDAIDVDVEKQLSELKDYSKEEELELNVAEVYQQKINNRIQASVKEVEKLKQDTLDMLKGCIDAVNKAIDAYMKDYKPFPTVCNTAETMSRVYTLGRIDGTIDVRNELPNCNIVFKYTNPADRKKAVDACKLYLCNALLSVNPKRMITEIYDPVFQSADFAEFFTPETKQYIKVNDNDFSKSLEEYRKISLENIQSLDHMDIDTYNAQAEKNELVTKTYRLFIMVSGIKHDKKEKKDDVDEDTLKLREYIRHSREAGVLFWLIDTEDYPGTISVDGDYKCKQGAPIQYTTDLGKQTVETFVKTAANYRDKGISYKVKFADRYIPREKYWQADTIKGIDLNFGLLNGDPNRGDSVRLGDDNVHCLMGGATGAGKSAAINQMIVTLICKYAPSELQMAYVDFKNVEAAKFTRGVHEDGSWMTPEEEEQMNKEGKYFKRMSYIPHFKLISGTTDGEYALSVFEFLMDEMARRQKILNKYGEVKIEDLRKHTLQKYNEMKGTPNGTWADMRKDWDWYKPNIIDQELELPRFLIILDEFQVMFNDQIVDPKVIDKIEGRITALTKLARAMGCHLWFTSQSMKGTISQDTMSNFSLRAALRCTSEVSEQLLGNDASSKITAKFGFMYTNDSAGQNKEANKMWRVPFLDAADINAYVDVLNGMLEPNHEKAYGAEFFDDKQLMPAKLIDEWYTNYPEAFANPTTFILGERAEFSTNRAPITMTLQPDSAENILVSGFELADVVNDTLTLIQNIRHKSNCTMIMNVMDRNAMTLLGPEQYIEKKFMPMIGSDQDVTEFLDTLTTLMEKRASAEKVQQTIYIILVCWEKVPDLSASYRTEDKLKHLLTQGPSAGMHFIIAMREKLDTPKSVSIGCNHKMAAQTNKDVYFFVESGKVEKLPTASANAGNFAIYEYGSDDTKFKIYQHEFAGEITKREVTL